jgi:hypothetical protein
MRGGAEENQAWGTRPGNQFLRHPSSRRIRFGNIVSGAFTPVLAKHSKSFSLIDCIAVGVDRMQRNFEPMRKQVETWQGRELTDVTAKVVIYQTRWLLKHKCFSKVS